jgi:hypothetical protein
MTSGKASPQAPVVTPGRSAGRRPRRAARGEIVTTLRSPGYLRSPIFWAMMISAPILWALAILVAARIFHAALS